MVEARFRESRVGAYRPATMRRWPDARLSTAGARLSRRHASTRGNASSRSRVG